MNPENATSGPASAATSASAPPHRGRPTDVPSGSVVSEAQYLREESAAALASVQHTLDELKSDVFGLADPRPLLKSHPWLTLASAAVAGFTAAAVAVPSKDQQALRRLAAIHRAMNARHPADGNGHEEGKHKPSQEGIGAFLVREAVGLIKPVLFALVTSQLNPKPAEPASETAPPASSEQGS